MTHRDAGILHVAFLWHLHQPEYRDLRSGQAQLPWVRLHAARHYRKMAALVAAQPEAKVTFNWVPCLIEQIEAVALGGMDGWMRLAEQDAWSPQEAELLRRHFVPRHFDGMAAGIPGYPAMRGKVYAGERLSPADLRDLTTLFALAWCDPAARVAEPDLAGIAERGSGFSREDLLRVHAHHRAAAAAVLPLHRRLSSSGQVEVSTSPAYHPILPILLDPTAAREASPGLPLPPSLHASPDSVRAHIGIASAVQRRVFGRSPSGMWPPEMAVGPTLAGAIGDDLRWLVVDEGLAHRCDARGPDVPYAPHRVPGDRDVAVFFRDREISDRISFVYADQRPEDAVDDFIAYAHGVRDRVEAGVRDRGEGSVRDRGEGGGRILTVALDGENPWERFPDAGEAFLSLLYRRLAAETGLEMITFSEFLDRHPIPADRRLGRLAAGSWIRGDLTTWIGHAEQNAAWERVAGARRRLAELGVPQSAAWEPEPAAGTASFDAWVRWRSLWAAEGSDWFWWLGPEHPTDEDAAFRQTFETHLANAGGDPAA